MYAIFSRAHVASASAGWSWWGRRWTPRSSCSGSCADRRLCALRLPPWQGAAGAAQCAGEHRQFVQSHVIMTVFKRCECRFKCHFGSSACTRTLQQSQHGRLDANSTEQTRLATRRWHRGAAPCSGPSPAAPGAAIYCCSVVVYHETRYLNFFSAYPPCMHADRPNFSEAASQIVCCCCRTRLRTPWLRRLRSAGRLAPG